MHLLESLGLVCCDNMNVVTSMLPIEKGEEKAFMAFELPLLPYGYDVLEPYIDTQTMQLHHYKYHANYVNNLNNLLASNSQLASLSIEGLLRCIDDVPNDIRSIVRHSAGGHLNHTLLWQSM